MRTDKNAGIQNRGDQHAHKKNAAVIVLIYLFLADERCGKACVDQHVGKVGENRRESDKAVLLCTQLSHNNQRNNK